MTRVVSGEELEKGIREGVKKLNDAVSDTLGPNGRTVLIKDRYGKRRATKDGVSVAKAFEELEDEVENEGAQMVKEVSLKSAQQNGDGTTTGTLMAATIIEEGYKAIGKGSNRTQVKKGIDDAVKQVLTSLKANAIDITEDSQIKEVATISGNNDPEIGELIATALDKVGREGVVSVEKSKSGETSLEVVEGMEFDKGYISPYFVTNNDTMVAFLEEPMILIYDGTIMAAADLLPVMNLANDRQKPLLIIAEDVGGEALSTLVVNRMRGIVNSVAVKAPDFGDRKKAIMEDLAIITGGEVISVSKGLKLDKLSNVDYDKYLGTSRTATISKEKTTIVDGKCLPEDIEKRAESIKTQIELSKSMFEKEKLQERLGRMVGGVAIINVGGNSELEIEEKKDRVEDALFATKSALDEGVLPGGGSALLYASQDIKFSEDKDIKTGQDIIYRACFAPFYKILQNAGYEEERIEEISSQLITSKDNWLGYDLKTESIVNMKERGIIDPHRVTKSSIVNSSSVAGTILTTNNLVYEVREKEQPQIPQMY